jgi:GDPmannose 4,6-dehydratase
VAYDKRSECPAEVELLIGDPAKASKQHDWEPKVKFRELVKINADLVLAEKELLRGNAEFECNQK